MLLTCPAKSRPPLASQVQYEDGDEDPRIKFLTYELVLDEENGATLVRVTRSAALNSKECTPEAPKLSVAALPSWAINGMPTMFAAALEDGAGAAPVPGMTAQRNGLVQASAEAAEPSSTVLQPAGPAQAFARAAKTSGTASLSTGHTQASARAAEASGRAADPAGHMQAPAGAAVSLSTVAQPSTISMAAPAAMQTQLGSAEAVADAPSASTAAPVAVTAAGDGAGRLVVQAEESASGAGLQQGGSAEAANGKPQQSQTDHHGKDQAVPQQHTREMMADVGKAGKQRGCEDLDDPHGEATLPAEHLLLMQCRGRSTWTSCCLTGVQLVGAQLQVPEVCKAGYPPSCRTQYCSCTTTHPPMAVCDQPMGSTKMHSKPKPACRWQPAWPGRSGGAQQPGRSAA